MNRRGVLACLLCAMLLLIAGFTVAGPSQHATSAATSALPRGSATPARASRSFLRPPLATPTGSADHSPTAEGTPTSPTGRNPGQRSSVAKLGPDAAASTSGPSAEQWHRLRVCESGDNYGQRANPKYRGGYQIGFVEWATYGGTGRDPADAPAAEQDAVALRIWLARGWEPWVASSTCSGLR